jgi:hypothetical protein
MKTKASGFLSGTTLNSEPLDWKRPVPGLGSATLDKQSLSVSAKLGFRDCEVCPSSKSSDFLREKVVVQPQLGLARVSGDTQCSVA